MENLPKLTAKQEKFVMKYFLNDKNASDAYRFAYNSDATDKTVWENASKLLKHTKVIPWVEHYDKNIQTTIQEEINYTKVDAMREYEDLQKRCSASSKTYNVEKGCIDGKCKLAGLITEKHELKAKGLADILDELR